MAQELENAVLAYLRDLDQGFQDIKLALREVKERLTAVEHGQGTIMHQLGTLTETDARLYAGVDRLRDDVARIYRRLDIADEPTLPS